MSALRLACLGSAVSLSRDVLLPRLPSVWTSLRHGSARVVAGGQTKARRQLRAALSIVRSSLRVSAPGAPASSHIPIPLQTPRAAQRLQELLAQHPGKLGIRIGVRTRATPAQRELSPRGMRALTSAACL